MTKKEDNSSFYVIIFLLAILYFFKDKILEFYHAFFGQSKNTTVKETVNVREENINNLGMVIPDLKGITKPIDYIGTLPKYNNVSSNTSILQQSQDLFQNLEIAVNPFLSRTQEIPTTTGSVQIFDVQGFQPLSFGVPIKSSFVGGFAQDYFHSPLNMS